MGRKPDHPGEVQAETLRYAALPPGCQTLEPENGNLRSEYERRPGRRNKEPDGFMDYAEGGL